MRKPKAALRFLSLVLVLSFISGQVFASPLSPSNSTVATPNVSNGIDGTTTKQVEEQAADVTKPGAIARGQYLVDLLDPTKLPLRIEPTEDIEQALFNGIWLGHRILANSYKEIADAQQAGTLTVDDVIRLQQAQRELLNFYFNFTQKLWLNHLGARGKDDYRAGFNLTTQIDTETIRVIGPALEVVERILTKYANDPMRAARLIAQYITHESILEKGVIIPPGQKLETLSTDERERVIAEAIEDHRAVYQRLQIFLYGEDDVKALGEILRDSINAQLGLPNLQLTDSLTVRPEEVRRVKIRSFAGARVVPNFAPVTALTAVAVKESGLIGAGRTNAGKIDEVASLTMTTTEKAVLRDSSRNADHEMGEGPKDKATAAQQIAGGTKIVIDPRYPAVEIITDPVDGSSITAEGKPGGVTTLMATRAGGVGRVIPDAIRIEQWTYPGKHADISLRKDSSSEIIQKIAAANGKDVSQYEVWVTDREYHAEIVNAAEKLGVKKVRRYNAGTMSAMLYAAAFPERNIIVAGRTGSTETKAVAHALRNVRYEDGTGMNMKARLVSENSTYDVEMSPKGPGTYYYKPRLTSSGQKVKVSHLKNALCFTKEDVEALQMAGYTGDEIALIRMGDPRFEFELENIAPQPGDMWLSYITPPIKDADGNQLYDFEGAPIQGVQEDGDFVLVETLEFGAEGIFLVTHRYLKEAVATPTQGYLAKLVESGTKYSLDSVDPVLIDREIANGATSATSNPIIISNLVGQVLANIAKNGGPQTDFERGISKILASSPDEETATREITKFIVGFAAKKFRPSYDASNKNDGYVSIEVDPRLEDFKRGPYATMTHDQRVAEIIRQAVEFSKIADNILIKIPATEAGLASLEELARLGINLNVTLIFTQEQARIARENIWRGYQQRKAEGKPLNAKSVYSIFVSRTDDYTSKKAPELTAAGIQGEVGTYVAKLIYLENKEFWADKGLKKFLHQEMIFASTGSKAPEVAKFKEADVLRLVQELQSQEEVVRNNAQRLLEMMCGYVYALAGGDIQTNPPLTAFAVNLTPYNITRMVDMLPSTEAREKLDAYLASHMEELYKALMTEGIDKFVEPQIKLVEAIRAARAASLPVSESTYRAALPISGKKVLQQAVKLGKPVLACNIDNGELSALQIPAMMEAARKMNAFIIFEVGPAALKTYAKGKPQLPEYCAKVALDIYKRTGYSVSYAVHLDHNQIDSKKWKQDKAVALQEAIVRAKFALASGFTSFATDTSTITDLDKQNVKERLADVVATATEIMRVLYRETRQMGIEVGYEGEVGDIGKEVSTVEEALAYYQGLVVKLADISQELGVDFAKEPLMDVIALNLGTSHGYDFDNEDRLKPYTAVTIDLNRAKEVAAAFKKLGLNVGVALHGFSGTPVDIAPQFIGTGIAKVNINTDWQAMTWKVLKAYYPELYKELFMLARGLAAKDAKKGPMLVTDNADYDFEHAQNRIIFGFARTLFRSPEHWPLLERITKSLAEGTDRRRLVERTDEQAKEDYLKVQLVTEPDARGLTSSEMLYKLTNERVLELMNALQLKNSAEGITAEREKLKLQDWQKKKLAEEDAAKEKSTADVIARELEPRAHMYKECVSAISARVEPKKKGVIFFERGIGKNQESKTQELYNALRMRNPQTSEPLFQDIVAIEGTAREGIAEIEKLRAAGQLDEKMVFVVGRKESANVFDMMRGNPWKALLDDSKQGDYEPVAEAAILLMMGALRTDGKIDEKAIGKFYNDISQTPMTPEILRSFLSRRVIFILPKTTSFSDQSNHQKKLYDLAAQALIRA